MTAIEYLKGPTPGWFPFAVMQCEKRGRDWVALMVIDPRDSPSLLDEARQRWLRIPGKHRTEDAARAALENMIATRH